MSRVATEINFGLGLSTLPDFTAIDAAVALERQQRVGWPLDAINKAMAVCYNSSRFFPPRIYIVRANGNPNGQVVGYLTMPYDEHQTPATLWNTFWEVMSEYMTPTQNGYQFSPSEPIVLGWSNDAGINTGIVGYATPFGPDLPAQAINEAILTIMLQDGWRRLQLPLFLYQVCKNEDDPTAGVIVGTPLDNVGVTGTYDDHWFVRILKANENKRTVRNAPEPFRPRRIA